LITCGTAALKKPCAQLCTYDSSLIESVGYKISRSDFKFLYYWGEIAIPEEANSPAIRVIGTHSGHALGERDVRIRNALKRGQTTKEQERISFLM